MPVGYLLLTVFLYPALLVGKVVDLPDDFLPYLASRLSFFGQAVREGYLPEWDPYRLGGASIYADLPSLGPYYPVVFLVAFLPLGLVYWGAYLVHFALGAWGMHVLCRESGAGPAARLVGACCYLSSTTVAACVIDGQADLLALLGFFPWVLVGLIRADSRDGGRSLGPLALAAAATGGIFLGSHTRFAGIAAGTLVVWAGVRFLLVPPGRSRWRAPLQVVLVLSVGILVAGAAVLPTLAELVASRPALQMDLSSLRGQASDWGALTGLVYPRVLLLDHRWYTVGPLIILLPLMLGDRRLRSPLCVAVLLLLFSLGHASPLFFLIKPFFSFLFPVEGGLAALAVPFLAWSVALAADSLLSRRGFSVRLAGVLGLLLPVLLWLGHRWALVYYEDSPAGVVGLEQASLVHGGITVGLTLLLVFWSRRPSSGQQALGGALVALVLASGAAYTWRVHLAIDSPSFSVDEWLQNEEFVSSVPEQRPPERIMNWRPDPLGPYQGRPEDSLMDLGPGAEPPPDPVSEIPAFADEFLSEEVHPNVGTAARRALVSGRHKHPPPVWSSLVNHLESELLSISKRLGVVSEMDEAERKANTALRRRDRLLDLLHVRWIVERDEETDFLNTRRMEGGALPVLERQDRRPVALVSRHILPVRSLATAEALVLGSSFDARSTAVLVSGASPPSVEEEVLPPLEAQVLAWRPGLWHVGLPGVEGMLTVAVRHHRGWRAQTDDGRNLETHRVNMVQLGVEVPADAEGVRLWFSAPLSRAGRVASVLGILMLLAMGAAARISTRGEAT